MGRLVIILLLAVVGCFGQISQNTVFFKLASNATALITYPLPAYDDIGQVTHQISVTPNDITPASCSGASGWSGVVTLEGSFDNSNWVQIGFPLNGVSVPVLTPIVISIQGAYPYIRGHYVSGNTGQCQIDIWYSGSLPGSVTPVNLLNTTIENSLNSDQLLATCPGTNIAIYSLFLTNGAGVNGFTLKTKHGAAYNTGSVDNQLFISAVAATFPANTPYIIPVGSTYFMRATSGSGSKTFVGIQANNATNFSASVSYRCE